MGDGLGAATLQSGFVVAVLIAAILLAERLGGDEGLARKATHVAIGFALVLVVFSGTTAFLRPPEAPADAATFFRSDNDSSLEEFDRYSKETAQRASEAGSIHLALGMTLAVIGGALVQRLRAIAPGLLLGGVLLLLLGASHDRDFVSISSVIYGSTLENAGQARDIVRFIVLFAGTIVLLEFAYWRWDRPSTETKVSTENIV
jgi:hypothetical protein